MKALTINETTGEDNENEPAQKTGSGDDKYKKVSD